MEKSSRTIALILVVVLGFMCYKTVSLGFASRKVLATKLPHTIGMGEELRARVDSLELQISSRIQHEISVAQDPLRLSKVIVGAAISKKPEFVEAARQMRLSCTIVSSDKSTAIIKYRDHSYVLSVGDSLASMQVVSIDAKKAVLNDKGKEVVLLNEPAPVSELRSMNSRELEKLQL